MVVKIYTPKEPVVILADMVGQMGVPLMELWLKNGIVMQINTVVILTLGVLSDTIARMVDA